jgi:plasmid stabilization system protein ParE
MRIKILSTAENDLEEAYHFYESQSEGLGTYFLDTLYSDIDSLAYFAGMHRVVLNYHRLLSKRFPFAIYYRIADDTALVYAVLDCRKSPNWIRAKLSN